MCATHLDEIHNIIHPVMRVLLIIIVNLNVFYRYIDQGRNPQLYTKDCLEKALVKNEQVKGKIDSLKVMIFYVVCY